MISRYYHTLKFLKWQQLWYRLYFPIKKIFYKSPKYFKQTQITLNQQIDWLPKQSKDTFYRNQSTFKFLNLTYKYKNSVNWEFMENGHLFQFHLQYFNWLHQTDISFEDKLWSIHQFINNNTKVLSFAYPIAIRLMNWYRFLIENELNNQEIYQSAYQQAHYLSAFPEYQLQGNHLLICAIGIYQSGLFFDEKKWIDQGKTLLITELKKQILEDGAHYECSPMYHVQILEILLNTYYLSLDKDDYFEDFLRSKLVRMYSWLKTFIYSNQTIAHFGDSTGDLTEQINAIFTDKLFQDIEPQQDLWHSGFQKVVIEDLEIIYKHRNTIPDYQPGHRHADVGSFNLFHQEKEVITDAGISTYDDLECRLKEKSDSHHNVIFIKQHPQLDFWNKFRIGKRQVIKSEITEFGHKITYFKSDANKSKLYERFFCNKNLKFYICDRFFDNRWKDAEMNIHLNEFNSAHLLSKDIIKVGDIEINFIGYKNIKIVKYLKSIDWHKQVDAYKINATVDNIETKIVIYKRNAN